MEIHPSVHPSVTRVFTSGICKVHFHGGGQKGALRATGDAKMAGTLEQLCGTSGPGHTLGNGVTP